MHDLILAWAKNLILERKAAWTIALQQLSTEREYQKIFLETFVSERKKTEKKTCQTDVLQNTKQYMTFFNPAIWRVILFQFIYQVNNNL